MAISIIWHGHGTFTFNIDGTHVVVDPFFAGNNPAAQVAMDQVKADFILQTHGHYDHIPDTVPLAKRTGATVIACPEILNWISKQGYDKGHGMNLGGSYDFPFGNVKMTPALHGSGLPDGSYGGVAAGFLITAAGKKFYIAGDTALFSDMALIGRAGLDLALLPIGDNFTMGPDDSILAIEFLKPAQVIPYHYNTWPPIAVDVEAWANQVRSKTSAEPIILTIEESFSL
jgi:L-ascorbate metabolism protein UlaG (beta-lactamase superfamily)